MKALANILSSKIILSVSGIAALLQSFIHKYIFSETEYLIWLVIAISLDLLTGIVKVWAKEGYQAVTSKGIRMTVVKFIQYGSFLIITHVLSNVQMGESKIMPFHFVKDWAYTLLLLIEIKSVYENITAIDNRFDFIRPMIDRIGELIKDKKRDGEKQ